MLCFHKPVHNYLRYIYIKSFGAGFLYYEFDITKLQALVYIQLQQKVIATCVRSHSGAALA